jgi:hypothetical protein
MTTTAGRSSSARRTERRRGGRLAFMMVESGHGVPTVRYLSPLLPAVPEGSVSCAAPAVGDMKLSDKFLLLLNILYTSMDAVLFEARLAPQLITGQKKQLKLHAAATQ